MHTPTGKETALYQFIQTHESDPSLRTRLHDIKSLADVEELIHDQNLPLTAAIIPLEQATRPPNILVESSVIADTIPWRILRCPGGPLVLQVISRDVSFAAWVPEC